MHPELDTMGVIGANGKKYCLFPTRTIEDEAVKRSPLAVAQNLTILAAAVVAASHWIPVSVRLPEGEDAVSCEAWCEVTEDWPAGPCIMGYAPEEPDGPDRWQSREDTGCWEPGPVTHWRPRPIAPIPWARG